MSDINDLVVHPNARVEMSLQQAEAWVDKHTDERGITNEAGGIMRVLISYIMEDAKQNLKLKDKISRAPHGTDCGMLWQSSSEGKIYIPCNCWKAQE